MEADSQISGNKTIDNKSILSLNYVYKKIIIKENYENNISELRTLNYEKIAKYKMKKMNLKLLLNSIFQLKKTIKKTNPLLKYIKNIKPYYPSNININISQQDSMLNFFFKYNVNNKSKKREIILNLSSNRKNYKNLYYSRMANIESKRINNNKDEKIILIQKYVRGFLSKKIIDEEVNKIIAKKIIKKILIIQRVIRKFLRKKKSLSGLVVNIIHNERIKKSNKVTDIFCLYHYRNFYKKNLLIKKILKVRNDSILLIQNKFKSFLFIKKVKEILKKEKNAYVLTYPFVAKTVQIKIYMSNSYKLYNFSICPVRKYFVLYIDKESINEGEYLCNIIVNDSAILDKRYKYIVDKNNILYNLIYIGDYKNKEKEKEKEELENEKIDINNNLQIDKINIKEKRHKKDKRKKHKRTSNDKDNEFFYYCYNENSNSTNSLSTSEHEKNKLRNKGDKEDNKDNNNKSKDNNNINYFLKEDKKKEIQNNDNDNDIYKYDTRNKSNNIMNINTGKTNKNQILMKKNAFDIYHKKLSYNDINVTDTKDNIDFDEINSKKDSIKSQQLKYINILDELSQSASSSSRSNFSMKNINSYSKKTHKTKFCSNNSIKKASLNKKNKNNTNTNIENNSTNKNKKRK